MAHHWLQHFGMLYLISSSALVILLSSAVRQQPIISIFLTLLCTATVGSLYHRLQMIVRHLFYGGWYNHRLALKQLSQAIGQSCDCSVLAHTFSQNLRSTMQLECVRLLLSEESGALRLASIACSSCTHEQPGTLCLHADSPIFRHFQHQPYPIAAAEFQHTLKDVPLAEAEQQLLFCDHARLWIPLFTGTRFHGLCILGSKRGGQGFNATDVDILQVVARQASASFQNSQLIATLEQRAAEAEQLHQQILRAREEERKRIARELHDQIIQGLVGLNYHLSDMRARPELDLNTRITELQGDIRQILGEIRSLCANLRPPALDSLGLVAAVRSRLRELERQEPIQVALHVEGDVERRLPEDVALCVFRVLQEALSNVQKHAAACRVVVSLRIQADEVCLMVEDDGRGFHVPPHLGQLLECSHFGLVGLRERLELVSGALSVMSRPDHGTCLRAWVPLSSPDPPLVVKE